MYSTAVTNSGAGAILTSKKLFVIIVTANDKNPKNPITRLDDISPSRSESILTTNLIITLLLIIRYNYLKL